MSPFQQSYQLVAHALQWLWGAITAVAVYVILPIFVAVVVFTVIAAIVGVSTKKKRENLNG